MAAKRTGKALRKERKQEFRQTNDVNDALFSNLAKQVKRANKSISAKDERILERINKAVENLQKAGRREVHQVTRREDKTGTEGGMLSGVYTKGRKDASRAASSSVSDAKAGEEYSRMLGHAAKVTLGLAEQGVAEAKAGAQYQTAQALTYRAQQDARFVADLREKAKDRAHQLKMLQLQMAAGDSQAKKEKKEQVWFPMKQSIGIVANATAKLYELTDSLKHEVASAPEEEKAALEQAAKQQLGAALSGLLPQGYDGTHLNSLIDKAWASEGSFGLTIEDVKQAVYSADVTGQQLAWAEAHPKMVDRAIEGSLIRALDTVSADPEWLYNQLQPANPVEVPPVNTAAPATPPVDVRQHIFGGPSNDLPTDIADSLLNFLNPFG